MAEKELYDLGDKLRDHLIDEYLRSTTERDNADIHKYKALRLCIDPVSKFSEPCFKVQIGLLEAIFSIDGCVKLAGGLVSNDEVAVKQWYDFGSNRGLLRMYWLSESVDKGNTKITPFDME